MTLFRCSIKGNSLCRQLKTQTLSAVEVTQIEVCTKGRAAFFLPVIKILALDKSTTLRLNITPSACCALRNESCACRFLIAYHVRLKKTKTLCSKVNERLMKKWTL